MAAGSVFKRHSAVTTSCMIEWSSRTNGERLDATGTRQLMHAHTCTRCKEAKGCSQLKQAGESSEGSWHLTRELIMTQAAEGGRKKGEWEGGREGE